MPKKINKRTLNKIKKRLPIGWKESIAVELNLQPETVRKVMGGIRWNDKVLERAIDMAELPETEKSNLINLLSA